MKDWGIRFEIIISLVLLVSAAAGLMGLLVYKHSQREMIALKVESGLILSRSLQDLLEKGLDAASINNYRQIMRDAGFDQFVIIEKSGKVIVSRKGEKLIGRPTISDLREAMATRQIRVFLGEHGVLPFGKEPSLTITAPIIVNYDVIGGFGLHSDLIEISKGWKQVKWIIIIYLLLDTLIIVFCGVFLLSRRIVGPLKRINRKLDDFASGSYTPGELKKGEAKEIGRLEESFESMARQLVKSQSDLRDKIASLKETQEQLIRSEKMATIGRLASGLAHELGNPLGSLVGFVHLLKSAGLTEDEKKDYLQRMESEMSRMDGIIRSLLDFARQKPAEPGPVDLNRIILESLALSEVQKWFENLTVDAELSDDLPFAYGAENRLKQVLINLMANAGQAMPSGGSLSIKTWREGGELFASITDSGMGIDSGDLPYIFDPFFTKKDPGQGTGLGLSVSQSIVESLGGRIDVRSRLDEGSTFTIVLKEYSLEAA